MESVAVLMTWSYGKSNEQEQFVHFHSYIIILKCVQKNLRIAQVKTEDLLLNVHLCIGHFASMNYRYGDLDI